jgi:benzodiazapine receptor
VKALAVFLVVVAAAAVTGAQFQPGDWYAALDKPSWTPPNAVFGPVWTLLYLGIAVAGWLVWQRRAETRSPAFALWVAQLLLNTAWSWLFFGLHRPGLALVDIVVLLATIVAFVVTALPVSRLAAGLFVPYALWVGYASALNLAIWRTNPG